jgi:enoyl-CoA hydratase/carnithine racemase
MASNTAAATKQPILLREDSGGVCTLTLNRPAEFNALSEAMLGCLQESFDDIAEDPSVRVVVLPMMSPSAYRASTSACFA